MMDNQSNRISLADWVANVRISLEEAMRRRKEMELSEGGPISSGLSVEEITLEATIECERSESTKPKFSCWIVELEGKKGSKPTATQKVTIKLKPQSILLLGDKDTVASQGKQFLPAS